ncbi:MAG: hypothetical protein A2Y17_06100 [Clostridiales bacterium GWF2_38_85]|nr:MAG: hypothetical protein A2Y17_06100 [Clostridiales bacterium GWF2_38_85]HBL85465.1 hypothetical protein [Clostridiales bacterium]
MTDFNKIKHYYSLFDEQHRLEKSEGRLEFDITFNIILQYLKKSDNILDLGGGAGKYSIELAKQGFKVTLADLSERLLEQAKLYINENSLPQLQGFDIVNAIDLNCYKDESFDSVLLFGPLYHLLESDERNKCVSEVWRVLKPNGIVFASYIPYLSGAIGIVNRAMYFSDQVDINNLEAVFESGKFRNNSNRGFQEGYYPTSNEIEQLFNKNNFTKIILRSIRGIGYNKEEKIYEISDKKRSLFDVILKLINETATNPSIVETGGHAIYIGCKNT